MRWPGPSGWRRRRERLDLAQIGKLDFEAPDLERFPALRIAREALEQGGAAPTVLNAANEVAVASFLAGRIGFTDIASLVEQALERATRRRPASIDDVIDIDRRDAQGRRRNDRGPLPLMLEQPPLWFILIAFICAIGPLVFIHELGHYLVARCSGSAPKRFRSASAARSPAGPTSSGTRWKVGWLPLGGYVRFVGDMNPASAPATGGETCPRSCARAASTTSRCGSAS